MLEFLILTKLKLGIVKCVSSTFFKRDFNSISWPENLIGKGAKNSRTEDSRKS